MLSFRTLGTGIIRVCSLMAGISILLWLKSTQVSSGGNILHDSAEDEGDSRGLLGHQGE